MSARSASDNNAAMTDRHRFGFCRRLSQCLYPKTLDVESVFTSAAVVCDPVVTTLHSFQLFLPT